MSSPLTIEDLIKAKEVIEMHSGLTPPTYIICYQCYDDYLETGKVPKRHNYCFLVLQGFDSMKAKTPT